MTQKIKFPCSRCGAQMTWSPQVDALLCGHCGNTEPVIPDSTPPVERLLSSTEESPRGYDLEVRESECGNCGARIAWGSAEIAANCPYCASSHVLPTKEHRRPIRPESVVPLDIDKKDVESHFRKWVHARWFRPNALKKARFDTAVGIYTPYWLFDCQTRSNWNAQSGYHYTVRDAQGRTQTRTRWKPSSGRRADTYDDFPLSAGSLPIHLARDLGQFKTSGLLRYKPEYLAGWSAEEYRTDLDQGWAAAGTLIRSDQAIRCAGDVPGDTHRGLRVNTQFSDVRWQHVLFPVWSLQYRFGGERYTVLINGQTGRVAGDAPYSWVKIAFAVLGVGFALMAAGMFVRM